MYTFFKRITDSNLYGVNKVELIFEDKRDNIASITYDNTNGFQFNDTVINNSTIKMAAAVTTGVAISGATTNGVYITGSSTTAFKTGTGTFTTGLLLGGTLTTGISIGTATTGITLTGTYTTGLSIVGATNNGISVTLSSLAAGDSYSGISSYVTSADPSNSYGASSYFETDISGTQAGEFVYGSGSWINTSATIGSGKYLCAQDNGIYYISGTLTGAKIIFGMRMEIPVSMAAAGRVCPFSINTNNVAITALIDCNNISDLGSASSKNTTSLYAPYAIDAAGNIRYVLLYS